MSRTSTARTSRLTAGLAALAAAVAVVGIVWAVNGSGIGRSINAEGVYALPFETLEDWVTYSDAVVVFHTVAERELPPSEDEIAAGEGLIIRAVTVEITSVVWQSPDHLQPPEAMVINSGGWVFHGDERTPLTLSDSIPLTVGHDFVAPVLFDPSLGSEWGTLGPIIPADGGVVGAGSEEDAAAYRETAVAGMFAPGATLGDLTARVTSTPPDPRAAEFPDLRHTELYHAIVQSSTSPEPYPTETGSRAG